jgi:hypothetical protein
MVEGGPLERTARRGGLALAIAALAAVLASVCAQPAAARPACVDAILEEWSAGALDSVYPLDCYDAAIDALPEDLRAYTTAADDISRAAIAASRSDAPVRQLASAPGESETVTTFPVAVVVLAALVALLAASGTAAALIRRGRAR